MNAGVDESPLVTFALFAYNQERFIREAVEGALAQTYSPLEIILSDDCSQDGTFTMMEECVKHYSGPHKVVLNRNTSNLGLADHINTVVDLSNGDLVVLAAGDDISYSERTAMLVAAWLSNGKPVAMCSGFDCITDQGVPDGDSQVWYLNFMPHEGETREQSLRRLVCHGVPAMIGCTEAWSRDLFSGFPALRSDVWFEDNVQSFRAWLIGNIHYLPERLVAYRQHETNISNSIGQSYATCIDIINLEKKKSVWCSRMIAVLCMHQIDIDCAFRQDMISRECRELLSVLIDKQMDIFMVRSGWWQDNSFDRWINAVRLIKNEMNLTSLRWILPRLLPIRWFALVQLWRFSR